MKTHYRLWIASILMISFLFLLTSCSQTTQTHSKAKESELTIGVTAGPHQQIMEQIAKLALKDHLKINIKVFEDYSQPNAALNSGDLDASSYETLPFLNAQVKEKGYKLVNVFKTVALPLGVYSNKIKNLKQLKNGDSIAISNDPSTEPRSLTLQQKAGVIKMRPGTERTGSTRDIISNPKNIQFVTMDPAQITSHLNDVTAAAINSNYAMGAHLTILKNAIFHESLTHNSYPNYFVVRTADKNAPFVKQLETYYHSKIIKDYIQTTFHGSVVPAW
ncbi:MAG: MetQ/NlpA family ABC transporter substrate-binding protein [Sporolactobacillus sp.]